jgi:hypothetical protein
MTESSSNTIDMDQDAPAEAMPLAEIKPAKKLSFGATSAIEPLEEESDDEYDAG